ncbi:MAG: FprA family A-type flavoprotein [Bacteroidales bacterium]|nr:FprA family A-type flavoprotein [Bacteroidales bacterium]
MNQNNLLKVSEDVSWIGVLDRDLVAFDIVMETKYGTTYNSYFINAGKKAVIDTVKEVFWPEYKEKLLALTDPAEIEYIICNHTEPDHSGSLRHLLELAPNATVVGSGQALTYLGEMMDRPFQSKKVKDGDVIDLGDKKLRVIGAPNLHWPDSIYTYLEEEALLFTCDSFGAHYADEKMMDDLVGDYTEAFDYYFDVILKPFSKFILKAIEKIKSLPIDMICPGHGPILRSSWKEKMERSGKIAAQYIEDTRKDNRVLVAYISAYGYTKEMAVQVAEGLKKSGNIHVDLVDIETMLLGDLEEHVVRADGIIIGSPTINQNTLLPVYKLFSVINPIRDKGKPAAAFGSFGWSGEAVKLIEDHLKNLKLKVVTEGLTARFYPDREESDRLVRLGEDFGLALQADS